MITVTHKPIPGFIDTDEADLIQPSHLAAMEHVVVDEGVFERQAGEPLSALRAVWGDEDGAVWPLDCQDAAHVALLAGVTLSSANAAGQTVRVQREGTLEADGLALVPGPVWLGADGALTQTPPESGFDFYLGAATGEHLIFLSPTEPIELLEE
jgi:hypothetical protein